MPRHDIFHARDHVIGKGGRVGAVGHAHMEQHIFAGRQHSVRLAAIHGMKDMHALGIHGEELGGHAKRHPDAHLG